MITKMVLYYITWEIDRYVEIVIKLTLTKERRNVTLFMYVCD